MRQLQAETRWGLWKLINWQLLLQFLHHSWFNKEGGLFFHHMLNFKHVRSCVGLNVVGWVFLTYIRLPRCLSSSWNYSLSLDCEIKLVFAPGGHKSCCWELWFSLWPHQPHLDHELVPHVRIFSVDQDRRRREERERFTHQAQPKSALRCSWAPWKCWLNGERGSVSPFGVCSTDHMPSRISASPAIPGIISTALKHKITKKIPSWHTHLDHFLYFCSCQWLVRTAPQWFKFQSSNRFHMVAITSQCIN